MTVMRIISELGEVDVLCEVYPSATIRSVQGQSHQTHKSAGGRIAVLSD